MKVTRLPGKADGAVSRLLNRLAAPSAVWRGTLILAGLASALTLPAQARPAGRSAEPARNPYLADSNNNQAHWNDAATDHTPVAVPTGHYCMVPGGAAIVPSDGLGIPAYGAEVGGRRIYWFFSGTALRKLELIGGQFFARCKTKPAKGDYAASSDIDYSTIRAIGGAPSKPAPTRQAAPAAKPAGKQVPWGRKAA